MMIHRLVVQNYKSLKELDIELRPLTVFVGPNAAGKSNIIDCLSFVADVAGSRGGAGIPHAMEKRGTFRDLVWGGEEERDVSISIKWMPINQETVPFQYSLKLGRESRAKPDMIIKQESGYVEDAKGKEVAFQREGYSFKYGDTTGNIAGDTSMLPNVVKEPLAETLRGWCFYDFLPSLMRSLQLVAKQTRLEANGRNVAALLHWLHSEEPEVFQRVEDYLKHAIPEVDRLLSPLTEDGKTYIAWREKAVPGRIPAWNMSEGSVRLVAILLALLGPEAPALVALETPEIHLHSYLMEYLAEILKTGSQRCQILATTHSTQFLNYLSPENLLIVKKEGGETKVEPVEDSRALRKALKTLGLGELYSAGHLGGVP